MDGHRAGADQRAVLDAVRDGPQRRQPPGHRRAQRRRDDGRAGTTSTPGRRSTTSAPEAPGGRGATRPATTPTTSSPRSTRSPSTPARAPPTGPKTPDFKYTGGSATIPGLGDADRHRHLHARLLRRPPVHGRRGATATRAVHVDVTWADKTYDWDLYLLDADGNDRRQLRERRPRRASRSRCPIRRPATTRSGSSTSPPPGPSTPRSPSTSARAQRSSRVGSYVGFCGFCDTITQGTPFDNGVATNVGGDKPGKTGAPTAGTTPRRPGCRRATSPRSGWTRRTRARSTRRWPGYGRRWAFPGAVGEDTSKVGTGHVFKSTDAGETFTDISGDLPDAPANWTVSTTATSWSGRTSASSSPATRPAAPTRGSGPACRRRRSRPSATSRATRTRWSWPPTAAASTRTPSRPTTCRCPPPAGAPGTAGRSPPRPARAAAGFKSVKVTPRKRGLRFTVKRRVKAKFGVEVIQPVARPRASCRRRRSSVFHGRTKSFTWKGRSRLTKRRLLRRACTSARGRSSTSAGAAFAYGGAGSTSARSSSRRESCSVLRSVEAQRADVRRPLQAPAGGRVPAARATARSTLAYTQRRQATAAQDLPDHGRASTTALRLPAAQAQARRRHGDHRGARSGKTKRTGQAGRAAALSRVPLRGREGDVAAGDALGVAWLTGRSSAAAQDRAEDDAHLELGERGAEAAAHAAAERHPAVGRRAACRGSARGGTRRARGRGPGRVCVSQIAGVTSVPAGSVSRRLAASTSRRRPASGTTGRRRSDSLIDGAEVGVVAGVDRGDEPLERRAGGAAAGRRSRPAPVAVVSWPASSSVTSWSRISRSLIGSPSSKRAALSSERMSSARWPGPRGARRSRRAAASSSAAFSRSHPLRAGR